MNGRALPEESLQSWTFPDIGLSRALVVFSAKVLGFQGLRRTSREREPRVRLYGRANKQKKATSGKDYGMTGPHLNSLLSRNI